MLVKVQVGDTEGILLVLPGTDVLVGSSQNPGRGSKIRRRNGPAERRIPKADADL